MNPDREQAVREVSAEWEKLPGDRAVWDIAIDKAERVIRLEKALQEARPFIAVVECAEGLTIRNLIGDIDAALEGEVNG